MEANSGILSGEVGQVTSWRVVATDDDPKLLDQIVIALRDAGHCVFAAYDGNSACELALIIPDLDLLVTNTRMGTVSAIELIRSVREKKPHLPILHVGEPLQDEDGLLRDVPNLREPFTAAQLLDQAAALVARGRPTS